MKNTEFIHKLETCCSCKQEGLFCTTPDGADYNTCPYCGKDDHFSMYVNKNILNMEYDFLYEDGYENDMRNLYNYCEGCKILFEIGCVHCELGCTSSDYNAHLVKRWKDKKTNIEYNGMPIFDSVDDWFNNVNDVEVLEMFCSSNGARCTRGYKIKEKVCYLKK